MLRRHARGFTAFGAALGLAVGMGGGCSDARTSAADSPSLEGPIAAAEQELSSSQICFTVTRAGASGSVFDTQVLNKAPFDKSFGASGTMNTGAINGEERQTLLRFDLSAVPPPASHTHYNAVTANLTLTHGLLGASGPGTIEAHRATAAWGESTVTWGSFAGAFDPTIEASVSNAGPTIVMSIPGLVAGWASGTFPNQGVLLKQAGPFATNFWTSEYGTLSARPSLQACVVLACDAGFADCNGVAADGCEVDITTPANCGGCGQACSVANATPACVGGACQIGACNLGFGDCDASAANGCETLLTTNTDCGGCGVACARAHATASCATGTCALTACAAGHHDCDGDAANGCEPTPCANGSHCAVASGCTSGVCTNGFCAAASCTDGVANGGETAVDCGGSCPPCADGQTCGAGSDCASGVCSAGVCQAPACDDGVKNGGETAADCGGGSCPACADGQVCAAGADCASGVCTAGVCRAPACNDGVKNGAETAVDCGGGSCPPCVPGKACLVAGDCVDGVCTGNVCQMASCTDGVRNGVETDVDCGGSCPACNPSEHCATDTDCDSGVCVNGLCQAATCTDGKKNGDETGVDCGGACFVAETCNGVDDDCNGLVDDGLGSITCGIGACQVTVPACVGGQVQVCAPRSPSAEVCDGLIDDDCDGVVDNGCACTNGTTQSCYTGAPTTLGAGVCHAGTQTCVHGQWGACAGEVTPTAETCNGLDDDCNGVADDGLGQTVCGVGECQRTQPNCVGGVPRTCTPGTPQAETCDGRDNDCDGQVDNGNLCNDGNACNGVETCQSGACIAGTAVVCNSPGTCQSGPGTCNPANGSCTYVTNDCDPNAFAFSDLANQFLSSQVTSNTLTITGFDVPLTVSVSGSGSPQLRVNGGSFVTSATINPGSTLQLRLTTSGGYGQMVSATVQLGTFSTVWRATTGTVSYTAYGPFGGCSSSCGPGTMSQSRSCVFSAGATVACSECGGACVNTVSCDSGPCAPPPSISFFVAQPWVDESTSFGYVASNADRAEGDVCKTSSSCPTPEPVCSSGSRSQFSWLNPNQTQYSGTWAPGQNYTNCTYDGRMRACKGSTCSGYVTQVYTVKLRPPNLWVDPPHLSYATSFGFTTGSGATSTKGDVCKSSASCPTSEPVCPTTSPLPWAGAQSFNATWTPPSSYNGCTYTWQMAACNSYGCSDYSSVTRTVTP